MPPIRVVQDFNVTGVLTANTVKIEQIQTNNGFLVISAIDSNVSLLCSNSANWESTYLTFRDTSGTFLTTETDSQTLSFDETTQDLIISNGNTVSLSSLVEGSSIIISTVEDYLSTNNVNVSSLNVGGISDPITLYVESQKVGINTDTPNEAFTVSGNISSTGMIYSQNGNSVNWNSVYSTFRDTSATFLTSETDSQTLSFDEISKDLIISNGNTVSLSSLVESSSSIVSTVENYLSTNNIHISSLNVGNVSESATLYVEPQKVGINTETPNESFTVIGNISSTGIVYSQGGNSDNWNSVYTSFRNTSSSFLTSETDSQTLSFNDVSKELTISNGNSITLSSYGVDSQVRTLTSNWGSSSIFEFNEQFLGNTPFAGGLAINNLDGGSSTFLTKDTSPEIPYGFYGLFQMKTGTTPASSDIQGVCANNSQNWCMRMIGTAKITYACRFSQYDVSWFDSSNNGVIRLGITDNSAPIESEPDNGVYFRSKNSSDVELVCRSLSAESTLSMGTVSGGIYNVYKYIISPDGNSVEGFLNGTSQGSLSSNIPTTALAPIIDFYRDTTTPNSSANISALLDFYHFSVTPNVSFF